MTGVEVAERIDAIVKESVEKGIALLDEHIGPDWPDRVDQETLDLACARYCVLGQVYDGAEPTAEQMTAAREIDPNTVACYDGEGFYAGLIILDGDVLRDPGAFGFSVPSQVYEEMGTSLDYWDRLQAHWDRRLVELKRRLTEGGENPGYGPGNPDWEHDRDKERNDG